MRDVILDLVLATVAWTLLGVIGAALIGRLFHHAENWSATFDDVYSHPDSSRPRGDRAPGARPDPQGGPDQ